MILGLNMGVIFDSHVEVPVSQRKFLLGIIRTAVVYPYCVGRLRFCKRFADTDKDNSRDIRAVFSF